MTTVAPVRERIDAANAEALRRLVAADPVLVEVAPAGHVVEGLAGRMILHAGPPVAWRDMCGAQRGSVVGLVLFEGWADSVAEAEALLAAGGVTLAPNHQYNGVGPMAGTTSPSLPVWVVENRTSGHRAFCRPTDAGQQFGDFSPSALDGLRHWRDVLAPAMHEVVHDMYGIALSSLFARALTMGDDLHNRPNALSSLFANAVMPALIESSVPGPDQLATANWLGTDPFFGLALSTAAAKCAADGADGVEMSTMVTAMARNGVEFGIRISGLPGRWFTAPAPQLDGLFVPGYSRVDAGLDMGDSAIIETVGWGGFVLGGALGVLALVGGTPEQAMQVSRDMQTITLGRSPTYRMPVFGFEGVPVGIDVRKVVRTGTVPVIDTAIAHREPGHPKIGGGLVRAPLSCFEKALAAYGEEYGIDVTT